MHVFLAEPAVQHSAIRSSSVCSTPSCSRHAALAHTRPRESPRTPQHHFPKPQQRPCSGPCTVIPGPARSTRSAANLESTAAAKPRSWPTYRDRGLSRGDAPGEPQNHRVPWRRPTLHRASKTLSLVYHDDHQQLIHSMTASSSPHPLPPRRTRRPAT